MRPIKYFPENEIIPKTSMICKSELFFIMILKQRQGVSGKGLWCWFDMAISRIADLEVERVDLENY